MKLLFDKVYLKNFSKITQNNPKLKRKIVDKLGLFIENQNHPSLRLHSFQNGSKKEWSISVNRSIRIAFTYIKNGILLLDIGTHEDIY